MSYPIHPNFAHQAYGGSGFITQPSQATPHLGITRDCTSSQYSLFQQLTAQTAAASGLNACPQPTLSFTEDDLPLISHSIAAEFANLPSANHRAVVASTPYPDCMTPTQVGKQSSFVNCNPQFTVTPSHYPSLSTPAPMNTPPVDHTCSSYPPPPLMATPISYGTYPTQGNPATSSGSGYASPSIPSTYRPPSNPHDTGGSLQGKIYIPRTEAEWEKPGAFKCRWRGCQFVQTNHRKPDLVRHEKAHLGLKQFFCVGLPDNGTQTQGGARSGSEYGCRFVGGCGEGFTRCDSYMKHLRGNRGCRGDPHGPWHSMIARDSRY